MGGGEFWTGMGGASASADTATDLDLKTGLTARGSDIDFTKKYTKTEYGRSMKIPEITAMKKADDDVHIHFDVNVLVNEDSRARIDPDIKVCNFHIHIHNFWRFPSKCLVEHRNSTPSLF